MTKKKNYDREKERMKERTNEKKKRKLYTETRITYHCRNEMRSTAHNNRSRINANPQTQMTITERMRKTMANHISHSLRERNYTPNEKKKYAPQTIEWNTQ